MKAKIQPKVIVCWLNDPESDSLNVLSFGGGDARVYEKDKLDSRCSLDGKPPPYFDSFKEAWAYMVLNPGTKGSIQLDTRIARKLGFEV